MQKIEIDIQSVSLLGEPVDFHSINYGTNFKRLPEPIFGLEKFTSEGAWLDYYLPLDKKLYVRISCGSGGSQEDTQYGCGVNTYTPFKSLPFPTPYKKLYSFSGNGPMKKLSPTDSRYSSVLSVEYHYNRILLPHWSDIQTQLTTLIQSFEVIQ